jgi:hypothetical protein
LAKKEEDEDYRPYDTLKAIGFTKDDAKGFLAKIEESAATQLPPEPKKPPEIEVKFREQKRKLRRSQTRNLLLLVGIYALAVWIYVVAIQVSHPDWIYGPFATWLPIRMDYVGEGAFVSSFIIIAAITMWNTRRSMRTRRRETDASHSPETTPA